MFFPALDNRTEDFPLHLSKIMKLFIQFQAAIEIKNPGDRETVLKKISLQAATIDKVFEYSLVSTGVELEKIQPPRLEEKREQFTKEKIDWKELEKQFIPNLPLMSEKLVFLEGEEVTLAGLKQVPISTLRIQNPHINLAGKFEKSALIVEPRVHHALPIVVRNILRNLGPSWPVQIYHGIQNEKWVKETFREEIQEKRVFLTKIMVNNLTLRDYNLLSLSPSFWQSTFGEKVLLFETDSALCDGSSYTADQFLRFDYIGAPWIDKNEVTFGCSIYEDKDRGLHYVVSKTDAEEQNLFNKSGLPKIFESNFNQIGNSGLSLRSREKTIQILRTYIPRSGFHRDRSNDIFFACTLGYPGSGLNKPTVSDAISFSVEGILQGENIPFGFHKSWESTSIDQSLLEKKCIDYAEIRDRYKGHKNATPEKDLRSKEIFSFEPLTYAETEEYVVAKLTQGFSNRVRSLLGAANAAKTLNRKLVLVWEKDKDMPAYFSEIFSTPTFPVRSLRGIENQSWIGKETHLGAESITREVELEKSGEVTIYSAYTQKNFIKMPYLFSNPFFNEPIVYINNFYYTPINQIPFEDSIRNGIEFFTQLKFQPDLEKKVAMFKEKSQWSHSRMVGLHHRSWGRNTGDTDWNLPSSDITLFEMYIEKELSRDSSTRFFLATDNLKIKNKIETKYRNAIVAYPIQEVERTTVFGQMEAIVEWMLLRDTTMIYGTQQSSFSDTAALVGSIPKINVGPPVFSYSDSLFFNSIGQVERNGAPYTLPPGFDHFGLSREWEPTHPDNLSSDGSHDVVIPEFPYPVYNPGVVPYKGKYLFSFQYINGEHHLANSIAFSELTGHDPDFSTFEKIAPTATNPYVTTPLFETQIPSESRLQEQKLLLLHGVPYILFSVRENTGSTITRYLGKITEENPGQFEIRNMVRLHWQYGETLKISSDWVPFVHKDALYALFSWAPKVILQINPTTGVCSYVDTLLKPETKWMAQFGLLRGGTPFLPFEEGFLTFAYASNEFNHIRQPQQFHILTAYLLDPTHGADSKMLKAPLVDKQLYPDHETDNNETSIVPSGAVEREDAFFIFSTKNESHILVTKIGKRKLQENLLPIQMQ